MLDQIYVDAARTGNLDIIKSYVENNGNINDVDKDKHNLLFHGLSHPNIVDYLLNQGMSPNTCGTDPKANSPLYSSMTVGDNITCPILLLSKNALLKSGESITAYISIKYNDSAEAQNFLNLLFVAGYLKASDLEIIIRNPITSATNAQCLGVVRFLIEEKGVSVETRGNNNNTLLHIACDCAKVEIVNYLVGKNSNAISLNWSGQRAIDITLFGGDPKNDNKDNISYRLLIVNALLTYSGKKLERLGWFDEWVKENKKEQLRKTNVMRISLAEPVEDYVVTQTTGVSLEACMTKQNATLERIADVLEKSLNISNQNAVDNKKSSTNPSVVTNFFPSLTPS